MDQVNPIPTAPARVLLAVTAHPDDESFGMGASLALYARQGVQVHLICATRGEVGLADGADLQGYRSVAELREAELRCAAQVLGLSQVHLLGYRDSGMPGSPDNRHPRALAAQSVARVADKIIALIREIKPQVVVTFDPIGGYHHPDHIAIHRATVEAFHAAGDPRRGTGPAWQPAKLYFHTMPHTILRMAVRILPLIGRDPRKFGTNGDIDLTAIAATRFPIHAVLHTRRYSRIQDAAAACHASQGGREMSQGPRAWLSHLFGGRDTYMRDFPQPSPGEPLERDLFAGIP